mmetsp:Transcript_19856/g.76079  ORF Transcript_19856/g.76079 Transcript_19856/m.76079 type:complete len:639 (+) Transcript_19856:65-1981(+)
MSGEKENNTEPQEATVEKAQSTTEASAEKEAPRSDPMETDGDVKAENGADQSGEAEQNGGDGGDQDSRSRRSSSRSRRSRSRSPRRRRSRSRSGSRRRRDNRERKRHSRSRDRYSRHRSSRHRDDDYDRRHRSSRSDRHHRDRDYDRDYDYDRDRRHERSRKRSREEEEDRHYRSKRRRRSSSRSPRRDRRQTKSAWDSRDAGVNDDHLSDVEKARRYAQIQQQQMLRHQHAQAQHMQYSSPGLSCRIYAGNMPYDGVTEEMVREAFAPYAPLKGINMVMDNQTGQFRGFCFVDFMRPEQAVAAQAMDGQMFAGRPLRIGPPSGPPVRGGNSGPPQVPGSRVFVGSVSYDMTADDVGDLCKLFGEVTSCQLIPNHDNGRHKGFGFVEFRTAAAAKRATLQLEGFEFGGRTLHTGEAKSQAGDRSPGTEDFEGEAPGPPVDEARLNAVARELEQRAASRPAGPPMRPPGMYGPPGMARPGMGPGPGAGRGRGKPMGILQRGIPLAGMPQHMILALDAKTKDHTLSNEDDISIGGNQRFIVMQKLANQLNECKTVCLRNMVTIDEVDDELNDEVTEECSKFGEVEKVVIYEEPMPRGAVDVQVYVFFKTLEASRRAQEALNGRFFARKQISAAFAPTTPF